MKVSRIIVLMLLLMSVAGSVRADARGRAENAYWLSSPAQQWNEAVPIGNGRLGALVYGTVDQENFVINEETVWSYRRDKQLNPKGPHYLKEIRRLLFAGEQAQADRLCSSKFMTRNPDKAKYQPVGTLHLSSPRTSKKYTDYRRGLRLDKAVSYVTYSREGVRYTRESFVPYNGDVIVHSFMADKPGSITFDLSASRPGNTAQSSIIGNNRLRLSGTTAEKGKLGVAFEMLVEIKTDGGKLEQDGKRLRVIGADRVTLYTAVRTDYNIEEPTKPLTYDLLETCRKDISNAQKEGSKLRTDHEKAFSALYNRVALELPGTTEEYLPINKLLIQAKQAGKFSADLLLLYYDYCRYVLISSSHPGGRLPATLQGIWNPHMKPAWDCDWHTNINLSMFYWPATMWDLSETVEPIIPMIRMCLEASRDVSQVMMGVKEGGFLLNSTDCWGATTPIRHPCWGMYVVGAAWLIQDALAPWYATRDPGLIRKILPLLRSQTRFFLGWLVRNPETGKWVSGPSASPENTYYGKGGRASVDMGCAHDQTLIAITLRDFIRFSKMQNPDDPLIAQAEAVLKDLAEPVIGSDGALQEWSKPFKEVERGHRHLSHTYGLMPGRLYSLHRTPEYAEAIRKSLQKRIKAGYHGMGWSFGWMASIQTRLNNPEFALKTIDGATVYLRKNLFTTASGRTQVADMNGLPAAINEMLLRNEESFIEILPALPKRWHAKGSFSGFCADRGFVISAEWKEGKVTALTVKSRLGGPCTLRYNGVEKKFRTRKGESVKVL